MNIDKKLEAARSVAWSAAWSARSAGSAEKKKQLQIIKEMLC